VALTGRVIASHYAEPVERQLNRAAVLREGPSSGSASIRDLARGEWFLMLDESLGWAWGYAGNDRRVGYLPCEALSPSAKDGGLEPDQGIEAATR
jgi:Bacterial dipeptidyl-peptidase Sh3 domain